MPPINLPVVFGSILTGAIVIDYGVKHVRSAFANAPAAASSPTTSPTVPGAGASSTTPIGNFAGSGYVNPLPHVTRWGRTDQGVDADATPGSPVLSIAPATVVGILQDWYSGQPYVWTQVTSGPLAGEYIYYAEQLIPTVKPGDNLAAGSQLGTVAASGTGLELGLATSSGSTLARATTGYVEGEVTPAGSRFRAILRELGAAV